MTTEEEKHWNAWNLARAESGLQPERARLFAKAVTEALALDLPDASPLLDVGCGAGWVARQVCHRFDYLGLDLASEAVEAARTLVPTARFDAIDFLEWSPDREYKVVVCVDAIAYFRDQDAALAKMAGVLPPGGWLIMTTLNPFVYSRMSRIGPPGKGQVRKWLTKQQFHSLIERHGFGIRRSYSICPDGDQGVLRWTNATKVTRMLNAIMGEQRTFMLKERFGLGQFRVVVARKQGG